MRVEDLDEKDYDIMAQRRKIVGEERRIKEEMKRTKEVEVMMDIMNKSKSGKGMDLANANVTFDDEGRLI